MEGKLFVTSWRYYSAKEWLTHIKKKKRKKEEIPQLFKSLYFYL
jgi:hypothetical protein